MTHVAARDRAGQVEVLAAAEATALLAPLAVGPLAVAVVPGAGAGLAYGDRCWAVPGPVTWLAGTPHRLVWWRAGTTAGALVEAGVRPRTCWDLGAVHRLLTGSRRDDPGAVWAACHDLPEPDAPGELTLLGLGGPDGPMAPDGSLSPEWAAEAWTAGGHAAAGGELAAAARWAGLALVVRDLQAAALGRLPDPRVLTAGPALPLLTAYAESAAALLAVELGRDGLPIDRSEAERLLTAAIGPRPLGHEDERSARRARDLAVTRHFPGGDGTDLRQPAAVRELLARIGIVVPDTRSWRLAPHRATSPAVAALLEWRRTERLATTYGYLWLDRHVGPDDRLRGAWSGADAAAGRMTASAGLHNLPAALRPAVAAPAGHVLVRADLGQVEPRVLAVVSGDQALARAAREPDMYAPVATQLRCDRPTAKVALLAAMYGQTSGPAGEALQEMATAYPRALAYLRSAELAGSRGEDLRTWGGRRLRLGPLPPGHPGHGRFARNAVVQGAAAELFKMWAVSVRAALGPLGGELVLCLHDELLLCVPAAAAAAAEDLLRGALDQTARRWAAGSPVRFVLDVAAARRWSDAKASGRC